jgi:hypothetical protein
LYAIIAAAIFAGGCRLANEEATESPTASIQALEEPPAGLKLDLKIDPPSKVGDPITLRLIVTNGGEESLKLYLAGAADNGYFGSYDLVAKNSEGAEVWSWIADGRPVPLGLSTVMLAHGDQLLLQAPWNRTDKDGTPVQSGTYAISGTFEASTDRGYSVVFDLATGSQPVIVS